MMGRTPVYFFLAISVYSAIASTGNENSSTQTLLNETKESLDGATPANASSRRGRHIIQERIELPINPHTKMQVIKIPSSISKVKLVQPPLNLRHSRGPQQFKKFPHHFRSGSRWNKKSEVDDFFDSAKLKRTLKKPVVREVSPEEFYRDEFEGEEENLKRRPGGRVVKVKRKKAKKNYPTSYEADDRPNEQEDGHEEPRNNYENENQSLRGYGASSSTIYMKQVPAPILSPTYDPEPAYPFEKQVFYNYIPEINVKSLPTKGRQLQSIFSQQYTTHNPHVTTNFGLDEFGQFNGTQYNAKGSIADEKPHDFPSNAEIFSQPDVAASEQVMASLPVLTAGIKAVQPPVFRDATVNHPSHPSRLTSSSKPPEGTSSQKATIKDILEQDCPSYDSKGYCESPPRYPMHQIKTMTKKCASLMEVMNTQPFDEPYDVYGFFKRSDDFSATNSTEKSTWSRSANDGHSVCTSNIALTEPGYAREVNSGRWFVIVQHPDTIIQRIATDTCRNPGKSCRGLYNLKCSKLSVSDKTTTCVQRYTYQRLISWDPESPEGCPRMRVFRFPSACVCHLGVA